MNVMFHRLFAAALISQPVVAEQKNTDWMFCVVTDGYNDVAYVTDIFHGNYDLMESYQEQFRVQVVNQFGGELDEQIFCIFESDKSVTQAEFELQLADSQDFYADVVTVGLEH